MDRHVNDKRNDCRAEDSDKVVVDVQVVVKQIIFAQNKANKVQKHINHIENVYQICFFYEKTTYKVVLHIDKP